MSRGPHEYVAFHTKRYNFVHKLKIKSTKKKFSTFLVFFTILRIIENQFGDKVVPSPIYNVEFEIVKCISLMGVNFVRV